jgi:hypothetical protein
MFVFATFCNSRHKLQIWHDSQTFTQQSRAGLLTSLVDNFFEMIRGTASVTTLNALREPTTEVIDQRNRTSTLWANELPQLPMFAPD